MRFYTFILLFSLLSMVWTDTIQGVKKASLLIAQDSSEVSCKGRCPGNTPAQRGSGRKSYSESRG